MTELTEREREVVGLVMSGLKHRAIASHLGISLRSVERLLSRARVRTESESTLMLCVKADLAQR